MIVLHREEERQPIVLIIHHHLSGWYNPTKLPDQVLLCAPGNQNMESANMQPFTEFRPVNSLQVVISHFFAVFYQNSNKVLLKQHCSCLFISVRGSLTQHKNAVNESAVRSERSRLFPPAEHAHLRSNRFLRWQEVGVPPALESPSCKMLSVNILWMFLSSHCWGSPRLRGRCLRVTTCQQH